MFEMFSNSGIYVVIHVTLYHSTYNICPGESSLPPRVPALFAVRTHDIRLDVLLFAVLYVRSRSSMLTWINRFWKC